MKYCKSLFDEFYNIKFEIIKLYFKYIYMNK